MKKRKAIATNPESNEYAPFSVRAVVRAIKKGSKNLFSDAMKAMGHVIQAEGDWVVKIYPDGTREKISPIGNLGPRATHDNKDHQHQK